jgi:hypothetical protein
LPDRLVERGIEAAQLADIDGGPDARLPEIHDRPAQQAVFGDDMIQIESARQPIGSVIFRQGAKGGQSRGVCGRHDFGEPR